VTDSEWADQVAEAQRAGAEWLLLSPIFVTGLEVGPFLVDVEVSHGLRSDTVGLDHSAPVVRAVTGLVRADGEPLGGKPVTLDLGDVAADAVIWASRRGRVYVARGDGSYVTGFGETHHQAALATARALGSAAWRPRFKWTAERNGLLADLWKQGWTATRIGDALGHLPARKVRAQKAVIADAYGLESREEGGRPRKGNT
jgi:hypothetical protein